MESTVQFHAQKAVTETIPSGLFIPSRLKKSTYKSGMKIITSCFSTRPHSHMNRTLVDTSLLTVCKSSRLDVEKMFLEISQNSQENICTRDSGL